MKDGLPAPGRATSRPPAAALRRIWVVFALGLFALPWTEATAQTAPWPARPIRMIVPNAPSGLADITARLVSARLADALGQPVLVDNRPGAGGTIGTAAAVKSSPDGHTLLAVFDSHATNPHLFRQLPYDTLADLAPVSLLVRGPLVLVVNPGVPARNAKEFIAIARARPGVINTAVVGPGSPARLLAEMLTLNTGVRITQIPYKGAAGALSDLIGGQVDAMFATVPSIAGHLKSGRLRALAVTSEKASPALPGVPPMNATVPGFEAEAWVALLVPVKTPAEIVARLHAEVVRMMAIPEMRERLAEQGLEPVGSTPAEADRWIRTQSERWGKVIRAQKIVIEQQ
jgi:tripartite-type tricarboxylate transporter receptor subunit TctC